MRKLSLMLLLLTSATFASGPIVPEGWNGSYEPKLPNGAQCCWPADLNGTGLVGGAMVLVSDDKKEFALFALTYLPPQRERWQLLERHPMERLQRYQVSLGARSALRPFGYIKSCLGAKCSEYFTKDSSVPLAVGANQRFKPTFLPPGSRSVGESMCGKNAA